MRKFLVALPFVFLISLLTIPTVLAGDIARDVRRANGGETEYTDNYLELGVGFIAADTPYFYGEDEEDLQAIPVLNGRYEWKGLFVEAFTESYQGVVFGYSAYQSEQWSLEMIGTTQFDKISEEEYNQLEGIETRDSDFLLGGRATAYFGSTIVQFQLFKDISDTHEGMGGSILVGRNWQRRNWNFHSILGVHYQSEDTLDYYFGVDADEASDQFPEHDVSSGLVLSAELGATYPLSEKWIMRSTLIFANMPDDVNNSPLLEPRSNDHVHIFIMGISYVF